MLLKSLFKKNDIVAVGLSGGSDSVCLLHLLLENKEELGIEVKAINVEHGIRGENSLSDSQFVREHCAKFSVPLRCFSVSVPDYAQKQGISEETAARILRYNCFDQALKEGFCNKIATAHHAGDNAETVLMNIFRGSALSGATGIKRVSDDGKIVRPILDMTREEIEEYVKENNLPFVHDSSNDDNSYTRNFLRNRVIPLVKERFPGAESSINRFSSLVEREDELLNSLSDELITGNSVTFTDDIKSPLFLRACLKVLKNMGFVKDFESCHLVAIEGLKNSQTGAKITLKNNIVAYRSYDRVVFEKIDEESSSFLKELEVPFKKGENIFGNYLVYLRKITREEFQKNICKKQVDVEEKQFLNGEKFIGKRLLIDLDKLPYNAVIRTKRSGDSIITMSKQKKTLKKFLTERKIPSYLSEKLPLIAFKDKVFVVLGEEISGLLKVDENSKNIATITYIKKEN